MKDFLLESYRSTYYNVFRHEYFVFAAKVGKVTGFEQCLALYPRCAMPYTNDMLTIMNPEENVSNDKADENQNWCTYNIKNLIQRINCSSKIFPINHLYLFVMDSNEKREITAELRMVFFKSHGPYK